VILANPVMMKAYRDGIPANGKPLPDGSKVAKIEWQPKKITDPPFSASTPDTPARQVLLISHILVGCQQWVEPGVFGCGQQIAVLKRGPALLRRCADVVTFEISTNRNRRRLIEEDARLPRGLWRVSRWFVETVYPELNYSLHLFTVYHSIMSSILAPASRFSRTVDTGIRGPSKPTPRSSCQGHFRRRDTGTNRELSYSHPLPS
jgi:hypothetical protein